MEPHDREGYRWHSLFERFFNKLKNWRPVLIKPKCPDPKTQTSQFLPLYCQHSCTLEYGPVRFWILDAGLE